MSVTRTPRVNWIPEEDAIIRECVAAHPDNKTDAFREASERINSRQGRLTERSAGACEQHYKKALNPASKKTASKKGAVKKAVAARKSATPSVAQPKQQSVRLKALLALAKHLSDDEKVEAISAMVL